MKINLSPQVKKTDAQKDASASENENAGRAKAVTWISSFVLWIFCVRFPNAACTTALDDSWMQVLWYAHLHGLQFGNQIAFTYGPLGFLANFKVSDAPLWIRPVFAALLCFWATTGLAFLAARMKLILRVLVLVLFAFLSASLTDLRDDLFFDTAVLCWGLLCTIEDGKKIALPLLMLMVLLMVGAMIKFTFLIAGVFTICMLGLGWIVSGRPALAISMGGIFIAGFLGQWLALGQKLTGLKDYLIDSVAIAGSYNSTMGMWDFGGREMLYVVLLAAIALLFCMGRSWDVQLPGPNNGLQRLILFCWLGALFFLEWKHSLVRADAKHFWMFLVYAPIFVLALEALPVLYPSRWRFILIAAVLFFTGYLARHCMGGLRPCAQNMMAGVAENLSLAARPATLEQKAAADFADVKTNAQLPALNADIGKGTVDVFGAYQAYALMNALDYHPRPVFQSYTAYSRPLDELNESFYHADDAPRFVLFNMSKIIDDRFPPLEDSLLLRELLINYEYLDYEEPFMLLRRAAFQKPSLKLLKEGDTPFDRPLLLLPYGDADLWIEVEVQPSTLGKLMEFVLKPAQIELHVKDRDGNTEMYMAPAPMLAAGFIASPLLTGDEDVARLYVGDPVKRPEAIWFTTASVTARLDDEKSNPHPAPKLCTDEVHYRIYQIQNKLGKARLAQTSRPVGK